jgi:hypothetical protein
MKEEFVANAVQAEMQHYHLYITHHVARATTSYWVKNEIIDNDMV